MRGESGHSPDLRLQRLLRPRTIAVVGGGVWCANVIRECRKIGFDGAVWPVHPTRDEVGGLATFASIADLPGVPDAAFIGVNRGATVEVLRALSACGAGGAVCFAAGFSEAQQELADGGDMQALGTLDQAVTGLPSIIGEAQAELFCQADRVPPGVDGQAFTLGRGGIGRRRHKMRLNPNVEALCQSRQA